MHPRAPLGETSTTPSRQFGKLSSPEQNLAARRNGRCRPSTSRPSTHVRTRGRARPTPRWACPRAAGHRAHWVRVAGAFRPPFRCVTSASPTLVRANLAHALAWALSNRIVHVSQASGATLMRGPASPPPSTRTHAPGVWRGRYAPPPPPADHRAPRRAPVRPSARATPQPGAVRPTRQPDSPRRSRARARGADRRVAGGPSLQAGRTTSGSL